MTYDKFSKIISLLKTQDEKIHKLYKLKVDIVNLVDPYHEIIQELLTEIYGESGHDWFYWFCYESDYGRKDWNNIPTMGENGILIPSTMDDSFGAQDKNGKPICYDIKSTWEYLEEQCKS